MPRKRTARFECGHPGCTEVAHYEFQYRDEAVRLFSAYGNGKYRCVRHSDLDSVLSKGRRRIVHEMVSVESVPGHLYWNHFGFAHGPGFRAFCDDFPPGTILRVIAEIILPEATVNVAEEVRSSNERGEAHT